MTRAKQKTSRTPLAKTPTGIEGLDEVTGGGLPRGRTTLLCGSAGCGKTLLGMEFLVHGALQYGEPGVCLEFEETSQKLMANVQSLGLDLSELIKRKKLLLDNIRIERNEIEETGEYNLDGLFVRLSHAVQTIKAKRVVLDSIESLFAGLTDHAILRAELRRLFLWLDEHNLTAIVTAERGTAGTITRHGLEEYLADCVILLDHRVNDQISTRRLRVVKYRGTAHGADEYPYLIDNDGISVLPITSMALNHKAPVSRVSTGVAGLDGMLGGKGFFRGSSVLVSGAAGTGKSTLAAKFAAGACVRGETCLYFAFEESPSQIVRNMRSVGIHLEPWIEKGSLHIHAVRPASSGLEGHLSGMQKLVKRLRPDVVVVDPVTSIVSVSGVNGVKSMLTRLVDFLKVQQITSMFTHLTFRKEREDGTDEGTSSLMDTWIAVSDQNRDGQRTRAVSVVKSRGMAHSRELHELVVNDKEVAIGGRINGGARAARAGG